MRGPVLLALLLISADAHAFWQPGEIARTGRGIRVRLHEQREPYRIADLHRNDDGTWRHVIPADWAEAKRLPSQRAIDEKRCIASIPYRPLDPKTAIELRPHLRVGHAALETPEACIEANGMLWFGLGFYEGEGHDGVGGIGRSDRASKTIDIRRPEWVRDKSVNAIAVDGDVLWLGVWQQYEKDAEHHGLARFDWSTNVIEPLRGEDAPCGWAIADLLLDGEALWVTTNLALSRRDRATGEWTHSILSRDGSRMNATSCRAVYRRIAGNSAGSLASDGATPLEAIAHVDPRFAREFLLAKNSASLHPSEARLLGTLVDDYAAFHREVLDAMRPGHARDAAIEGFAGRPHRERAWRDFLLAHVRQRKRGFHLLRHFRGDDAVFRFLAESLHSDDAIRVLPWIDARRAISLLIPLMNDLAAQGDRGRLPEAIEAMERAAHLRIEADGATTNLAPNSDTPDYADEEFGAFTRHGAGIGELRAIVKRWSEWAASRGITAQPPR